MSSAATASQPGLRHRPRPALPARRPRRGADGAAGRVQPRRDHAARPCSSSTRAGPPGRPTSSSTPGRRPPPRAPRLHLAPLPGTDLALANGLLHLAVKEGLVDEDYIADAHHRLRRRPGRRRVLLARPGRADHRRPRRGACAQTVHALAAAPSADDPHRPRRRAAQQRHRHRPGLDQPRAGPGAARPAVLGLRHHHRPGQRPGRPRARPEGRPAARLPQARRPRRPGARRRRLGGRPRRAAAARACRRSRCSTGSAPPAASAPCSCSPPTSSSRPPTSTGSATGSPPSTCSSSPTSSCPRPPSWPTSSSRPPSGPRRRAR